MCRWKKCVKTGNNTKHILVYLNNFVDPRKGASQKGKRAKGQNSRMF